MPLHDWSRVDTGLFHHYQHRWLNALADALNTGALPLITLRSLSNGFRVLFPMC
jgi:hypothetical protein